MTVYNSNPASRGLGYGLGGQTTTASSASIVEAVQAAQFAAQVEMQQAQMLQAQLQQAQTAYVTVTSTGYVPFGTGYVPFGAPTPAASQASTNAKTRSMELFYDWCTPEQRKSVFVHNYFDCIGGDTGKRYRVYRPSPYNIHELSSESDRPLKKICFVPKDQYLPEGDIWLAQKLGLELDEKASLAVANIQTYHCF